MTKNILVTGATGNVGREVVRLLCALNYPVTAAVRNPIAASESFGSKVRCVSSDLTNPKTFNDAFAGINKLFLVRPPAIFIDVRDIAAVAVKILAEVPDRSTGEPLSNRVYDLTGAVALTYAEVATIFTTVLGRPIYYTNPPVPIFIWQMLRQGFSLQFVLIMVGIYTTTRFGLADLVTSDVQQLLNRSPISLGRYIEDYRECWL